MATARLRQPSEPLYALLREGRHEEFNRQRTGSVCDLRSCDLRGLDLRTARLAGASLHAARVSGVYFPKELDPDEIDMSVRLGTRMRYR
jgi:uncharacterized protein YjbI with pentapeptide repeats